MVKATWLKTRHHPSAKLPLSPSMGDVTFVTELNAIRDESASDVAVKAELYEELLQAEKYTRFKLAADAWCAAFVIPKTNEHPAITDSTTRAILQGHNIGSDVRDSVRSLAQEYQFLHPHLTFPDVFEESGGFDLVIGNPPWDQIQYDPRETFAVSHPDIATATTMAARNRLIDSLADTEPETHARYLRDRHRLDGTKHYINVSGSYPLSSAGRLNTAPLFVELMWSAIHKGGRVGVIVPTGFATDSFKQGFFNSMVDRKALVSLFDFENRKKLFPAVDGRQKFCLLTLTGEERPILRAEYVFYAHEVADLDNPEKRFVLSAKDFSLLNPNTRTTPTFRSRRDANITKTTYNRMPVLLREGDPEGNPWNLEFQLMFMMNTDSHLFRTREELEGKGWTLEGNHFVRDDHRYLPLYEGKMVGSYDHRSADVVKSPTAKTTPESTTVSLSFRQTESKQAGSAALLGTGNRSRFPKCGRARLVS